MLFLISEVGEINLNVSLVRVSRMCDSVMLQTKVLIALRDIFVVNSRYFSMIKATKQIRT